MKKIIFRKLLLDCLTFFFLALFGISTIIWVFQAVNFLDIMIEDGRNYNVYFNYTLLNFPKIISRILPFALFFSFAYTLVKYEANNELIIFWNHGVSKLSIVNFFFLGFNFDYVYPNSTIVICCSKISGISKVKIKILRHRLF
jgi:lipopolysaccharide export system permease protein